MVEGLFPAALEGDPFLRGKRGVGGVGGEGRRKRKDWVYDNKGWCNYLEHYFLVGQGMITLWSFFISISSTLYHFI